MEVIGFSLAIVSEVRTNAKSLKERYDCYQKGPQRFQNLSHATSRVNDAAEKILAILGDNPNVLPHDTRGLFFDNLQTVNEALIRLTATFEELEEKGLAAAGSSHVKKTASRKVRRVVSAKSIDKQMEDMERELKNVEATLQMHLTQLIAPIKIDEMQSNLLRYMQGLRNCTDPESKEAYHPANMVPPPLDNLCLNFDTQDENRHSCTPEGKLRLAVLSSTTSSSVIAARGASDERASSSRLVHGASGMAGVGKTTALIALGHDEAIQSHFIDGVLFIRLGADASSRRIIESLAKIMRFTGASESAATVLQETVLENAVSGAALWFQGRCNLFLIDDVWPSLTDSQGPMPVLREILTGSPESRIALTTRSRDLVSTIGSFIDFGARDMETSRAIFLRYAANGSTEGSTQSIENLASVQGILRLCDGLPIALAACGQFVAAEVSDGLDFESACDSYYQDLVDNTSLGATVLESAIRLSLKHLVSKSAGRPSTSSKHSMYDMYISLSVLEKQQWIPISVLARMWGVDDRDATRVARLFKSMSLAKVSAQENMDGKKERGLQIHDLHNDFCREEAMRGRERNRWHFSLLQGHVSSLSDPFEQTLNSELTLEKILEHKSKKWYSEDIPNRQYLLENLTRHIGKAGLVKELWGIVIDPKWWHALKTAGGLASLKRDLLSLKQSFENSSESESAAAASRCIDITSKYLEASALASFESAQAISYSVLSRLLNGVRDDNAVALITSKIMTLTPRPSLVPITSAIAPGDKAIDIELNVGAETVECSPCGRYLAISLKESACVLILKSKTRDCMKKSAFTGSRCLKFSSSSKLVVALPDHTIGVWDWESCETPATVLQGHARTVTSIALSSDCARVFSASDDCTVKIWSVSGGDALESISLDGSSHRLAVHGDTLAFSSEREKEHFLRIMNIRQSTKRKTLLTSRTKICESFAFSKNGKLLAFSSQNAVNILKVADWMPTFEPMEGHTNKVSSLEFSPDSQRLASCSFDGTIRIWNVADGHMLGVGVCAPDIWIRSTAFCPGGEKIVSASSDGTLQFWDVKQIERAKHPRDGLRDWRISNFSLSGNGRRVLLLSFNRGFCCSFRNALDGREVRTFEAAKRIASIALDHSGSCAAYGSFHGEIGAWKTEEAIASGECWTAHEGRVVDLSFSENGTRLVSFGLDERIRVWDMASRRQLCSIVENHWHGAVALTADGELVIHKHYKTKMWRTSTQELVFDSENWQTNPEDASKRDILRTALRSCGPRSSFMWPECFVRSPGDLIFDARRNVYCMPEARNGSNEVTKELLACFSAYSPRWRSARWEFSTCQGILTTVERYRLVLCRLEDGTSS